MSELETRGYSLRRFLQVWQAMALEQMIDAVHDAVMDLGEGVISAEARQASDREMVAFWRGYKAGAVRVYIMATQLAESLAAGKDVEMTP